MSFSKVQHDTTHANLFNLTSTFLVTDKNFSQDIWLKCRTLHEWVLQKSECSLMQKDIDTEEDREIRQTIKKGSAKA